MKGSVVLRLLIFFICFLSAFGYGQNLVILKDSVPYDSEQLILEEIKINLKSNAGISVQNQIQNANGIFNLPKLQSAEERLTVKKDTLIHLINSGELHSSNYGFDHYEILYQNDNMVNLSILLQSFGSPFEVRQYRTYDLKTGNLLDSSYFKNIEKLKKRIHSKLEQQGKEIKVSNGDLANFILEANSSNKITGITFVIADTENYRNSGYEQFEINLGRKEIEKHLGPAFWNVTQ